MNKKSSKVLELYGSLLRYNHYLKINGIKFFVQVKDGMIYVNEKYILPDIRVTDDYKIIDIPDISDIECIFDTDYKNVKSIVEKFLNDGFLKIVNKNIIQPRIL
jgi:hypothetical protein